jgi:adenine-specific DNA-methyltransferase
MQHLTVQQRKRVGAHYTPLALAAFVARKMCEVAEIRPEAAPLRVLDPAVGDGALLCALLKEIRSRRPTRVETAAFDTDLTALRQAEVRVASTSHPDVAASWYKENFLDYALAASGGGDGAPRFSGDVLGRGFDMVIANPPYVRTHVLGRELASALAKQFGLEGRIDLYHAFLLGISAVLSPGGIGGVIVSNRFMTTQAGGTIRAQLLEQFDLLHIWDLGDTKLFEAAVLPAVLLLRKKDNSHVRKGGTRFTSVYSCQASGKHVARAEEIIDVVEECGRFTLPNASTYRVRQGKLDAGQAPRDVWRLSTPEHDAWLRCVDKHTGLRFADVGKIRVGVKTTADRVFIRSDWHELPKSDQPELLRPLITHHNARRFRARSTEQPKQILYTHGVEDGCRAAVDLSEYPRAQRYLETHRDQLEARTYVKRAGREWFEIWVPQDPLAWNRPKLVFRDISKEPTFWMDLSGAVVNGDCYWMTASNPEDERLLWTAMGVANSRFIEAYYDARFNNKLYAGRRRFMTQYVEAFPLPPRDSRQAKQIEECSRAIFDSMRLADCAGLQSELNEVVASAFGLDVEELTPSQAGEPFRPGQLKKGGKPSCS